MGRAAVRIHEVITRDRLAGRLELRALFGDVPKLGIAFRRRTARLGALGVDLG
jgi:hypothetical protein